MKNDKDLQKQEEPHSNASEPDRRKALKALAIGGAGALALPAQWKKPVVDSAILPAHAQSTPSGDCGAVVFNRNTARRSLNCETECLSLSFDATVNADPGCLNGNVLVTVEWFIGGQNVGGMIRQGSITNGLIRQSFSATHGTCFPAGTTVTARFSSGGCVCENDTSLVDFGPFC